MIIADITEGAVAIFGRNKGKVVRKYRCMTGQRRGRIVANLGQCFASPNIKKKLSMKRTRARLGARMARKARRTKRTNPASIALKRLNKRR